MKFLWHHFLVDVYPMMLEPWVDEAGRQCVAAYKCYMNLLMNLSEREIEPMIDQAAWSASKGIHIEVMQSCQKQLLSRRFIDPCAIQTQPNPYLKTYLESCFKI